MDIFGFISDVINLILSPKAFFRGRKTVIDPYPSGDPLGTAVVRVKGRWSRGPDYDLLKVQLSLNGKGKGGLLYKYLVPREELSFKIRWLDNSSGWCLDDSRGVLHFEYHNQS